MNKCKMGYTINEDGTIPQRCHVDWDDGFYPAVCNECQFYNSEYEEITMEDYKPTIGAVEYYKNKACELVKGNCDKCEAAYEYCGKKWCCFDTTTRFIKYANEYNI